LRGIRQASLGFLTLIPLRSPTRYSVRKPVPSLRKHICELRNELRTYAREKTWICSSQSFRSDILRSARCHDCYLYSNLTSQSWQLYGVRVRMVTTACQARPSYKLCGSPCERQDSHAARLLATVQACRRAFRSSATGHFLVHTSLASLKEISKFQL